MRRAVSQMVFKNCYLYQNNQLVLLVIFSCAPPVMLFFIIKRCFIIWGCYNVPICKTDLEQSCFVCVRCNIQQLSLVDIVTRSFLTVTGYDNVLFKKQTFSQSKKCISSSENELSPPMCTLNNVIGSFENVQIR